MKLDKFSWEISADNYTFSITINDTHRFTFDSSVDWIRSWIANKCDDRTIHEPVMSKLIYQFSMHNPNMVFFDIGAYLGFFSLLALSTSKGNMTVKSFEMNPKSCGLLQKSIDTNTHLDLENIEVVNCALSDVDVENQLTKHDGFNILDSVSTISTNYSESEISFMTLDNYCNLNSLVPDLIKIDVEGYEHKIIQGAKRILSGRKPTLLLELHSNKMLSKWGTTRYEVVQELLGFGYKIFYAGNHRINDLGKVDFDSLEQLNELDKKVNYGADDLWVFRA